MHPDMTLSPEGEQFIKGEEEEGGLPRLKTYDDGTGTPTIAWGCTEGVLRNVAFTATAELSKDLIVPERLFCAVHNYLDPHWEPFEAGTLRFWRSMFFLANECNSLHHGGHQPLLAPG
jgi:hypothetical protein